MPRFGTGSREYGPRRNLPSGNVVQEAEDFLDNIIKSRKVQNAEEVALLDFYLANLRFQQERLSQGNLDSAFNFLEEKEKRAEECGVPQKYIDSMGVISFGKASKKENIADIINEIEQILKQGE